MAGNRGSADEQLERLAEEILARMGYELVDYERAGHRARPILRLRVDRIDAAPGQGVTVDECARVSRALEERLDEGEELPGGYILEVSSPGLDRPLRKRRDFERNVGKRIALRGYQPLTAGAKRVEGVLLAVEDEAAGGEALRLRLADGSEAMIPLSAVARANLVFDWSEFDFEGRETSTM